MCKVINLTKLRAIEDFLSIKTVDQFNDWEQRYDEVSKNQVYELFSGAKCSCNDGYVLNLDNHSLEKCENCNGNGYFELKN
jgi:hypothetical protein